MLNREIQDAHTKLVEPSTSRSSRSPHDSSGSPSALQMRIAKKPKVTYRSRKSQDSSLPEGSSDDEEPVQMKKRVRSSIDPGRSFRTRSDKEAGSLNNSEHLHTSTQSSAGTPAEKCGQRRVRALTATDTSMPPPAHKSSGPTTQHIKSSGGSTMPFTARASSPPAANDQTPPETPQATDSSIPALELPTSGASRTRNRAICEVDSPKIILGEEVPLSSSAPGESPAKKQHIALSDRDFRSPTWQNEPDGGHDELSLSAASPDRRKSKRSKLPNDVFTGTDRVDELWSDDVVADLPLENYQPRPSRSRSTLKSDGLLIPEDFSKRPEALAKSKSKSKIKSKIKPKSKRVDVAVFEDSNQQQADTLLEVDADTSKKSKDDEGDEDLQAEDNTPPRDVVLNTEEALVGTNGPARNLSPQAQPAKKTRGRPKKRVPPQMFVDPPAVAPPLGTKENPHESSSPLKQTTAPTKRGRKRKQVTEAKDDDMVGPDTSNRKELEAASEGILTEINPNIQPSLAPPEKAADKQSIGSNLLNVPMKSIDSSGQSSEKYNFSKSTIEEQKAPIKNSPVQQEGKSVYRVGLSKRQRIPSLLRIVRK